MILELTKIDQSNVRTPVWIPLHAILAMHREKVSIRKWVDGFEQEADQIEVTVLVNITGGRMWVDQHPYEIANEAASFYHWSNKITFASATPNT